jgi:hypothetical protein
MLKVKLDDLKKLLPGSVSEGVERVEPSESSSCVLHCTDGDITI